MKKTIASFALTLSCMAMMSQMPEHRTCGTMDHHEYLKKTRPNYEQEYIEYNKMLDAYLENMAHSNKKVNATITIPVVLHVVYRTSAENISDAQAISQLNVLNNDFQKLNSDTTLIPSIFKSASGGVNFTFCLAQRDPNGNPTTGVVHKQTTQTSFTTDDKVKKTASGGDDAWDVTRYVNIWICNLGTSLLGYGEFPTSSLSNTYGLVINYTAAGTMGTATAPYNKGRTGTHEFGHCFNLYHIWGDDNGACTGSDQCNDTPNQKAENYGTPSFPQGTSASGGCCTSSDQSSMFMNYMDYVDDAAMVMFTKNQCARMLAVVSTAPWNVLQSSNGCIPVTANAAPTASFSTTSSSVCSATALQLTDQSTNSPTSWSWSSNPSSGVTFNTSSIKNPTATFSNAGTYTITLVASNSSGSSTYTKVISVNATPVMTSATTKNICTGSAVNLALTSSTASTYSWVATSNTSVSGESTTNQTTSTINNTLTISGTTTQNVKYSITPKSTAGACVGATQTVTVTVNPLPSVTATSASICAGLAATLVASGASTYSWNTGSSAANINVSPTVNTIYTVIGTSSAGCSKTATTSVTVKASPTVAVNNAAICVGTSTVLTASGATSYTWNTLATTNTISVTPTSTTIYTVTGTTNGCSNIKTATVTVNQLPSVSATSATICSGSTATLTATGASTYSWSNGSSSAGINVSPTVNTSYSVKGTSSAGCSKTVTVSVVVTSAPVITVNSSTICAGNSTTITATGVNTFTWNTGSNNASISVSPAATTVYTVSGKSNGCATTASKTTTVTVNPLPNVQLAAITGPLCSNGPNVTLSGSPSGGTYSGPGVTGNIFNPNSSGIGTFTITYNYTNPSTACSASNSKTVTVSTCTGIEEQLATDFTIYPNPVQSSFTIVMDHSDKKITLEIFDGIGKLVHQEILTQDETRIDVSNLAKGIYTCRLIEDSKSVIIKRWIKE